MYGFPSWVSEVRDDICGLTTAFSGPEYSVTSPNLPNKYRAVGPTTRWAASLFGTCTSWGYLFKEKNFKILEMYLKWENRTPKIINLKQVRNYSLIIGRHTNGYLVILWASKGAGASAEPPSSSFISFMVKPILMTAPWPSNPLPSSSVLPLSSSFQLGR